MTTNNPLVSVLMPAYNHEKYIRSAINSIIEQTYKNIELIIIDDGSTDRTADAINELRPVCEKRFVKTTIEFKKHSGALFVIKNLISLAKGEFIFFIASDDLAKPFAIEKEIEFLNENPEYGLAVGDNEIINSEGKTIFWDKNKNPVSKPSQAIYKTFGEFLQQRSKVNFRSKNFGKYNTLFRENYIPNGSLMRRKIFEKFELPDDPEILEDWFIMLQIAKYSKMKFLNEILFSYRWHNSNTINKLDQKAISDKTRNYEKNILSHIQNSNMTPEINDVITNGYLYKKQGIPLVFEILTYKKEKVKIKKIKFLGIKILEFCK